MSKVIVIDPGYSSFKIALVEGGRIREIRREPTIISEVPEWGFNFDFGDFSGGGSSDLEWENKKYLVGFPGIGGLQLPITKETLFMLGLPLFLRKVQVSPGDRVVVLVSLSDWDVVPQVKDICDRLSVECKVLPQGLGVWVEAGAPKEAVVVDIGFNTVDIIPFANGGPNKQLAFAVHETGLIPFLSQMRKDDPHTLARQLEQGDEQLAHALREHYWDWLKNRLSIRAEWKAIQVNGHKKLIFGGGGAHFVPSELGIVVKEPELANVRGVAKALAKKMKGGE